MESLSSKTHRLNFEVQRTGSKTQAEDLRINSELEDCLDLELMNRSLLSVLDNGSYLLHSLTREFFATRLEVELAEADALRQGFAVAMTAVARNIPNTVTLEVIAKVKEAIPHLEAATAYTALLYDEDCGWPHIGAARFYEGQSLWQEAEHWYKAFHEMTVNRFGQNDLNTAMSLTDLAGSYMSQGRYSEAEPLNLQAVDIYRSQLGENHPDTALSLNNLAGLYQAQGRYAEAEPLHLQALNIKRSQLGEAHPSTATSLNNLAALYQPQGRYTEAEPLYLQAFDIIRSQLGKEHPDTAQSLNNLALLYDSQGRYTEAEPLLLQALNIRRSQLGKEHPDTALSLNNLAALYYSQGRYAQAEPLFLQTLAIFMQTLGENHPNTRTAQGNFRYFLQQVVAAGQGAELSEHPLTQSILAQLQE